MQLRKPSVLLFIPVFNCAKQIDRLLRSLQQKDISPFDQILITDNGSTDGTISAIQNVLSDKSLPISSLPVQLVKNIRNYGLGGSHKIAFSFCKRFGLDFCVILHGDDQARLADLQKCPPPESWWNIDMFLGARFMPGSERSNYSFIRTVGNFGMNWLASLISRHEIYDLGSGLNVFRIGALPDDSELSFMTFPNDMNFHLCLMLAAISRGQRLTTFPIQWTEEDQVSNVKLFRQSLQILGILSRFKTAGPQALAMIPNESHLGYDVVEQSNCESA